MKYVLNKPLNSNYSAVEQILINRGLDINDIDNYLNVDETAVLAPDLIQNIKEGAQLLIHHLYQNSKIFIQIDSDCDGMTSAAVLLNYIYALFPNRINNIKYMVHEGKQHGINLDVIPEDCKLVIVPDAGSNDYEYHKVLHDKGIDVLVIDHHEAEKFSEYACVINNQLCDYPTKSLSGVGMVYKFISYLDKKMGIDVAKDFLDLVSVGLIADMMDLKDLETHYLVQQGLTQIRNPFLKTIIEKQNYSISKNGGLNPHTIGFYVAPFINATMRMGTVEEKLLVFEAMLDFKGYEPIPSTKRGATKSSLETRAEQACRTTVNIKNHQNKAVDDTLALIQKLIEEDNLLENKILVLGLKKEYAVEKNITGLIANKLSGIYQRPVLILNQQIQDGEITWEGSARCPSNIGLDKFRELLSQNHFVLYAQGHEAAFGVGIHDSDINNFIQFFNDYLSSYDFTPQYKVDLIWDADNFNSQEILNISNLNNIWGQGIEKPLVAIENIKATKNNTFLMKGNTLKIVLDNQVTLISFGISEEAYEKIYSENGYTMLNVVGECNKNEWNGNVTPQILIKDYELIGSKKYYF